MTWLSHILLATAVAGPLCGSLPAVAFGATAPDWLEWLLRALFRRRIRHRWTTHFFLLWLAAFGLALAAAWAWGGIFTLAAWFAFGGFSHVFADALTVTGVPLAPWSLQRITLAGGRIRTGDPGEFVVVGLLFVLSLTIGWCSFSPGPGAD